MAAVLAGGKPRPFRYRTLGVFVDLGQHKAVATVLGLRLRGFPAWFAARTYHLVMMPGMARRVRLGVDWTVGLVFGRASAELGQLGHPPSLGTYLDEVAQPASGPATRERAHLPRGPRDRPRGRATPSARRPGTESTAARGLIPRTRCATDRLLRDWASEKPLLEFMTAQPGGSCFLVARTATRSWAT